MIIDASIVDHPSMGVNVWQDGHMTTATLPPALPRGAPGCCGPSVTRAADPDAARELARTFKALADATRVQLLAIVAAQEGHEACVCDLTEPVGLSQPTVSHHLKILVDAGILIREQRGKWAYYRLVPDTLAELAR